MWVYKEIRTLGDYTAYHARHAGQRVALSYAGHDTRYATLDDEACRVARALIAAGVAPGQRVVYLGKNSDDFFVALFGTVKAGACFCPLNWRLSRPELETVLADSDAVFAFVEAEFAVPWAEILAATGRAMPHCTVDRERAGDDPFRAWFAPFTHGALPTVDMDAGAIQLYTSGTTGDPKGVVITHDNFNHMRLCEHFEPALEWRPEDRFLVALPNFHLLAIGLSLQSMYNGMAVLVDRQFEPGAALQSISRLEPTISAFAPAMIQMLLDHPDAADTDFSSLRLVMYAGSPISLGLIKRALAAMPCEFMQFYGATETSGAVTLLRPNEHDLADEGRLRSCGRPLPLIDLRIVDEHGQDVADGEPGELWIRSPSLASGYWRKPQQTAAVFEHGWYRSGDIAIRDAEGLYYIHDRLKDMIVSGGENIYSTEIESVLSTHPGVAAVAVIGVPDERWGEAVKACVVRKPGQDIGAEALLAYCRERLAGYKIPKSIDFHDAFPMTGSGKIAKKDLRAPFWAGQGRSVA
ncbi:MAG: long-chain-fatty-acid--CoA ligase [Gammaproteobacteria bacterium]|nr:long-chain-fatty-acid--CoA ligase [Gammaproteobacteria bacterium]